MDSLTPEALAEGRRLLEEARVAYDSGDPRRWGAARLRNLVFFRNHAPALLAAAERAGKAEAELARLREDNGNLRHQIAAQCERIDAQDELLRRLREERRWVPVAERLPEMATPVLVCLDGRFELVGTIHIDADGNPHWGPGNYEGRRKVTHWMPLPQPPEGPANG